MPNFATYPRALAAKAAGALLLGLLVAGLITAPAQARRVLGVGENSYKMFSDQRFQRLGVTTVRVVIPYDYEKARFDQRRFEPYLAFAHAQNMDVLVHFARSNRRGGLRRLPSVRTYRRSVAAFARAHPWVTDYGVWNEVSHRSQPTYRSPRRAAQYAIALHRAIPAARRIVVLDALGDRRMSAYTRAFRQYYRLRSGKDVWGLHNYDDANVWHKPLYTRAYLRLVPGKVWITETGGIVHNQRRNYGVKKAARATSTALRIARSSRRVQRAYFYHWIRNPRNFWDSAFFGANGKARPAYRIFERAL